MRASAQSDSRAGSLAPMACDTTLLARFEPLALITSGHRGTTLRARQRSTGRVVIIKTVSDACRRRDVMARVDREINLCNRLRHPHIVPLLDAHRGPDSSWFAYGLVDGQGLDAVLAEQRPLAPRRALRVMAEVLSALSVAHSVGILHRDLTPSNIVLSSTSSRPCAMVIGFGMGAVLGPQSVSEPTRATHDHVSLGRATYAAPELLQGHAPTTRSDLYAWALITLECLSGLRASVPRSSVGSLGQQTAPHSIAVPAPWAERPIGRLLARMLSDDPRARDVSPGRLLRVLADQQANPPSSSGVRREERAPYHTPPSRDAAAGQTASARPPLDRSAGVGPTRVESITLAVATIAAPTVPYPWWAADHWIRREAARLAEVARGFGGRLLSVFGHRVVFVFGEPPWSEDHALRAVRAAVAIVRGSADGPAARRGRAIAMALHTGETQRAPGVEANPLLGRAADIVDRLSRGSEVGEVRLSEATLAHLPERYHTPEATELQAHSGEPTRAYRLRTCPARP